MTTLLFKIEINATTEKVWKTLWDDESYRKWTNPFCKGSHYRTDCFTEGNKIHLLTPDGQGMYSILDKIEPNQFLAFRHLGSLKNFEEQPINQETEAWTNAMETYRLSNFENGTELLVSVDTIESHINFMNKLFPIALNELKKISEQ